MQDHDFDPFDSDKDKNKDSAPRLGNVVINTSDVYATKKTRTSDHYEVFLHDRISTVTCYRSLCSLLRNLKKCDSANLILNNYGGSVNAGIDIINAIRASKATIRTTVSGPLYSMAPLIALQGQTIKLEQNTFMMFHDYSSMSGGKGSEIEAHVKHMRKFMFDCFSQWTKGFLSKKEVEDTIGGADLYLGYNECKERLAKLGKLEA